VTTEEQKSAARRLQAYITRRLSECRNEIAPELMEYIVGDDETEIEAALVVAKTKTAAILQGIFQAQQTPDELAWRQNQTDGISDQRPLGTEQEFVDRVKGMSLSEFAKHREEFGVRGSTSNRGIFG